MNRDMGLDEADQDDVLKRTKEQMKEFELSKISACSPSGLKTLSLLHYDDLKAKCGPKCNLITIIEEFPKSQTLRRFLSEHKLSFEHRNYIARELIVGVKFL